MNAPLVPCPGNDPECVASVLEAEAAFEAAWRSARASADPDEIAQCWRRLADSYDQSLARLPTDASPAFADRLERLRNRARILAAMRSAASQAGDDAVP